MGAENVAKYGASTTRASWHVSSDSDSIISMLPDSFTAWHVRGYSSESLGVEICMKAKDWSKASEEWVEGTLTNLVEVVDDWCMRHDIPRVLLTKEQVDAGHSGITYHRFLDPSRRSDPGLDFPEDKFFEMLWAAKMPIEERKFNPRQKFTKQYIAIRAFQYMRDNGLLEQLPQVRFVDHIDIPEDRSVFSRNAMEVMDEVGFFDRY